MWMKKYKMYFCDSPVTNSSMEFRYPSCSNSNGQWAQIEFCFIECHSWQGLALFLGWSWWGIVAAEGELWNPVHQDIRVEKDTTKILNWTEGRPWWILTDGSGCWWMMEGVSKWLTTVPFNPRGPACWVVTLHRCALTHLKNWTSVNLIKIN